MTSELGIGSEQKKPKSGEFTDLSIDEIMNNGHVKRMQRDESGRPIPWFSLDGAGDGEVDLRIVRAETIQKAIRMNLCWVCGEPLGVNRFFVCGPISTLTRVHGEPPCHMACALLSVKTCPHLSQPERERRLEDLPPGSTLPVGAAPSRPKVICLWRTDRYRVFTQDGYTLFSLGEPKSLHWYHRGRPATHVEVSEELRKSIDHVIKVG